MLDEVSEFIRECLLHAADYRYHPQSPDDPHARQHVRDMELLWLDLAMSYEFASRSVATCAPPDAGIGSPREPGSHALPMPGSAGTPDSVWLGPRPRRWAHAQAPAVVIGPACERRFPTGAQPTARFRRPTSRRWTAGGDRAPSVGLRVDRPSDGAVSEARAFDACAVSCSVAGGH